MKRKKNEMGESTELLSENENIKDKRINTKEENEKKEEDEWYEEKEIEINKLLKFSISLFKTESFYNGLNVREIYSGLMHISQMDPKDLQDAYRLFRKYKDSLSLLKIKKAEKEKKEAQAEIDLYESKVKELRGFIEEKEKGKKKTLMNMYDVEFMDRRESDMSWKSISSDKFKNEHKNKKKIDEEKNIERNKKHEGEKGTEMIKKEGEKGG